MLALVLLLAATTVGLVVAGSLDVALPTRSRIAVGVSLGQLLLLWVPFLFGAAFGLGARTAGLLAIAALLATCAAAAIVAHRRGHSPTPRALVSFVRGITTSKGRLVLAIQAAFILLFAWLLHTHYLRPRTDGLHTAGVTWGNLPIHLGLISRFVATDGFAELTHPLFLDGPLTYPFLPDYGFAVLTTLGLPMRWAMFTGEIVALTALLLVLDALARLWFEDRPRVAALTPILFLLASGLGFIHVYAKIAGGNSPLEVLATTNATYIQPDVVLKSGHIGNLLVGTTAAYGMSAGIAALILLGHIVESRTTAPRALALAGFLIGSLPLIHSYSFIVLCGASAATAVFHGRFLRLRWAYCFVPLTLTAAPQLAWLMHWKVEGYIGPAFGFLREPANGHEWARDLLMGMGLWLLVTVPAFLLAPKRARRHTWPLLLLLPLANVFTFSPAVYNNVKLVAWFDVAAAILVSGLITTAFDPARANRAARATLATLLAIGCTLSGALSVGYELTNDSIIATNEDIELAKLVQQHTPPTAIIATAGSHHDPVGLFTGRRVLMASRYMLPSHGIDIIHVANRRSDVAALYTGGDPAREVIARLKVDAVVVGPHEREELAIINEAFFEQEATAIYESGPNRLYILGTR